MRNLLIVAAATGLLPGITLAQNVGNGSNYQTPSAPNYQAPKVPPAPTYRLPPLPEAPSEPSPAGGPQVFVKHIEVRGVTAFKPAAVAVVVAPYENEEEGLRKKLNRKKSK